MSEHQSATLPLRRTEALSCQQVGEETLVYDERTHLVYCLNATASLVWQHCDGSNTPQQLASIVSPEVDRLTGEAIVRFALAQLAKDTLITGYAPADLSVVSRRAMLAKGGAGLALMLPFVAMITAPKAAQAYSGCFDCSNASPAGRRRRWEMEQIQPGKH